MPLDGTAVRIGRRNAYRYACGHIPSVDWQSLLQVLCRAVVQTDAGGDVSRSFMFTRQENPNLGCQAGFNVQPP
jgi:hypothetical protein